MANTSVLKTFFWYNQTIDGKLVNNVHVRIFKPLDTVIDSPYEPLVATDGKITKSNRQNTRNHTYDYTYVVLSTGIRKKFHYQSEDTHFLNIKLYLTEDFHESKLDNTDFLGKSYVLEAFQLYKQPQPDRKSKVVKSEPALPPLENYLCKKVGSNYKETYLLLKTSAQNNNFDKVEQIFKHYQISTKYQALFWKELYMETANK